MHPLLEVSQLRAGYGETVVIEDLSLEVAPGVKDHVRVRAYVEAARA